MSHPIDRFPLQCCQDCPTRKELLSMKSKNKNGYVIYCLDYVTFSAGRRALYSLCDDLISRGYPAVMTGASKSSPTAPLVSAQEAKRLVQNGYVAIYPETVFGNPLEAKSVARLVMNKPGFLGGDKEYDSNEKVFTYSSVYSPYIKNKIEGVLYIPTIDESLFYCADPDLSKRTTECYYGGKSVVRTGYFDFSKTVEITRHKPSRAELADLLRSSRLLYCFDNSTILAYEAVLCGCPTVIIPNGTHSKSDYEKLEIGLDGIAWGCSEIGMIRPGFQERTLIRYKRLKEEYQKMLTKFIEITQGDK